jgi:predicted ATP-grasp superfamily ATP-dependent carboligase
MTGAIVLGADYRGLGIVRSLGRRGIPVWVVYKGRRGVATFSRYAKHSVREPAAKDDRRLDFLLDLVRMHGLDGWVLFATGDETTAFCARNRDELATRLVLTTPPWDLLRWAHDKRLTRELAVRAGVGSPRVWADPTDIEAADDAFPVVVKPAIRTAVNPLTRDKAWRANDASELAHLYAEACRLMPPEDVMIQELVPGDGTCQLSYATLAAAGEPIATVVARRTRQYPMDFGRASTFVESIDDDQVATHGERLVAELGYTGLIEIEFKRDAVSGELNLLDLNPRVWGWHTLGRAAGVDFPWLAWRLAQGERIAPAHAASGVRWAWPAADVPIAVRELRARRLSLRDYLGNFRKPLDLATLAWDDPLPGLVEIPLQVTGTREDESRTAAAVPEPAEIQS